MGNDLHDFARDMNKLASSLTGPPMRKVLDEVGVAAKRDAQDAARPDLGGDARFSGWPRVGALEARYSHHRDGSGITIHRAPRSAGPWRVAEEGRNRGEGPPAPAGLRRGRRRGRRWNGRTAGKNTWTDAENLIAARTPRRVEKAVEVMVMKVVGRGS
ncbi:MAG TPA: hypothetical protein VGK49_04480 [Ilumatobacteraceae bacterium]